jgi:hypothetical protein
LKREGIIMSMETNEMNKKITDFSNDELLNELNERVNALSYKDRIRILMGNRNDGKPRLEVRGNKITLYFNVGVQYYTSGIIKNELND